MKKTITTTETTAYAFETAKRTLEAAITNGNDYTAELMALSTAIAYSCINKCLDPQRSTAGQRETVSNNGHNPALLAVKNGIFHDLRILCQTATNASKAERLTHNASGDLVQEIADKDAYNAFNALISETLSDGLDIVQTAAVAIMGEYADHYDGQENFLDCKYSVRRLAKKVYIQAGESAAYRDEETTPIQEVYRAVRRAIQSSAAVQADPHNGYLYIEDVTADGLDTIYYRLQKWADLGGEDCDGHYTADKQSMTDYNDMMNALQLTDRQLTVVNLRMRGHGYLAIGTYLGITAQAVNNTLKKIQKKAVDCGIVPHGYKDGE